MKTLRINAIERAKTGMIALTGIERNDAGSIDMITLLQLLKLAVNKVPPTCTSSQVVLVLTGRRTHCARKTNNLTAEDTRRLCYSVISDQQKSRLNKRRTGFQFRRKRSGALSASFSKKRRFRRVSPGACEYSAADLLAARGGQAHHSAERIGARDRPDRQRKVHHYRVVDR